MPNSESPKLLAELRQLAKRGQDVWRLAPGVHRTRLAAAAGLMSLASAANTVVALLLGVLVDRIPQGAASGSGGFWKVAPLLVAILLVYVGREVLHVLRRSLVERSSAQIHRDLLVKTVEHVQRLDLQWLGSERIGALHGRIVRSVDGFVRFVRLMFLDCLPAITTGLIAIAATTAKQPVIGLAMLGVAPAAVWLTLKQIASQKNVRQQILRDAEAIDAMVIEQLSGAEYLRAANTIAFEAARLDAIAEARQRREVRFHFEMSLYGCGKAINEAAFHVVVLAVAAGLAASGRLSVGDVMTFSVLFLNVMAPLSELHRILDEGHEAGLRVADLTGLLALPEDRSFTAESTVRSQPQPGETVIETKGLVVEYQQPDGSRRRVLDGVSLAIRHGQTIGLAGRSGSGKSTLIKVLLRLVHPTAGAASIAGHDIETLSRNVLADLIGYVGQNPFVFCGTVEENIRYGGPLKMQPAIELAARQAHLDHEIEHWPGRYSAELTERGANLSGGQRQRLALARAFFKSPLILILDEATSALDNISERAIQQQLEHSNQPRTVLMIAHRLTTLRDCDRILVFDAGQIVESGRYDELLARNGAFAELVRSSEAAAS